MIRSRFPESWRKSQQVYDGHVKSSLKSEKTFHSFETERNFYVSAVAPPSLTMLYPCFSEAMGHAVTMCTEEAKGTQSICYFFCLDYSKFRRAVCYFYQLHTKIKVGDKNSPSFSTNVAGWNSENHFTGILKRQAMYVLCFCQLDKTVALFVGIFLCGFREQWCA